MTTSALGKLHNQTRDDPAGTPEADNVVVTPCDVLPEYSIDGHLRRVRPYHHTYNTWCKQRWRGRELLEIFADEFRDRPLDYYRDAILTGRIHLNGKVITSTTHVVKNGDLISHTLHRHEPPVTANPIGIVHEDDDMIVIDKPAGVPVHPTGRYNYNTVTEILRAERGLGFNPLPCNRLDRLTSGVMFVAKHQRAALEMTKQISERTVRKEYVARVRGEFPATEIVCERPILQISPKLGLNRVRAGGKEARTVFERLAYYPPAPASASASASASAPTAAFVDEGYSIVRCRPLTGRTHQLRVHLQFLGHPITNDPIYCNRRVFGPDLAEGDDLSDRDEDIMTRLGRMGKGEAADTIAYHQQMQNDYEKAKAEKLTGELCRVCQTPLYSDPGLHELGIYLHAKKYADQDGSWSYETALPEWALPPPGFTGPETATEESDPLLSDSHREH